MTATPSTGQADDQSSDEVKSKPSLWKRLFAKKELSEGEIAMQKLQPKLYRKRWFILFLFAMSNFLCSLYQTTFSSISTIALEYWAMPDQTWKVNMMALVYLVVYVPMSSLSSYVMKRYGLRTSMLIAGVLNFVGGWIRCVGYKKGQELYFWIAFMGQTFCAMGQPLISNAPTLLASNWFGEKERTLATTLGTLMGIMGSGTAFGIGPTLLDLSDGDSGNDSTGSEWGMLLMLGGEATLATVLFTCTVAFFKDKPPTAPVFVAPEGAMYNGAAGSTNDDFVDAPMPIMHEEHSFSHDLKAVMKNFNFLLLMVAYSVGYAVLQSFVTLLDQIIVPKGYTEEDGSIFGITVIVSGILGALIIGVIVDYTKRYKVAMIVCGLLAALGFAGFSVVMMWRESNLMFYMACISLAAVGMFSVPTVPLCLEMSVETTYPVPASTSAAILYGAGTLTAGIVLVILDIIQQVQLHTSSPGGKVKNNSSMQLILWIDLGLLVVSVICSALFRGKLRRMENEKLHRERSQAYLSGLSEESKLLKNSENYDN